MLPMILKLADKVKIEGESLQTGYEKQIDVATVEHALAMPMVTDRSSSTRTSGRCNHEPLQCKMRLNKAYPKLLEACARGVNLGTAELALIKMTEGKVSEVARYQLTDTYVSSVSLDSSGSNDRERFDDNSTSALPMFAISLSYRTMVVTYNEYGPDGASKGAVSCDALNGLKA